MSNAELVTYKRWADKWERANKMPSCKECKFGKFNIFYAHLLTCDAGSNLNDDVSPDYFCADGEPGKWVDTYIDKFYISRRIPFLALTDSFSASIALKHTFQELEKARDEYAAGHSLREVRFASVHVRLNSLVNPPDSIEITQKFYCYRPKIQ